MLAPNAVTMPCPGGAVKAVGYKMAPQFEFRFWLEADLRRRILDGVVAP